MQIKDIFTFYQEYIKPIYAEIEAKRNQIPVELLFETYASFDHLKRFYLDGENEEESSKKEIDFELIDNGNFIQEFHKKRNKIYKIAKEARLNESKKNTDEAFEKWYEVSIELDKFEEEYLSRLDTVECAKKKTFSWLNKDSIKGFIIGILSSLFVWVVTQ